ncbi:nuclear pore complex protein Nup153 isoform X2 [Pleurodeles waltl]|uniref:nuclear pore complex protein Nup153 isoform X2 n=1 Tax=Pleurodeles waltl TaxID=8319 RepID=UPI003709BD85
MASPPPGGGGGKIRTRRYHINAKPYSKSQQQGIIGRVTDSVKSIVPVWLQRYFNKNEDPSTNVSETRGQRERTETNQENDNHVYGHEETPPLSDGRVTPEPVSRHVDEPSTSRTLNFTDVLTRPSLHRSNLNFNMLDSPALHCQPSTSSAFPIGSSAFSFVKEIKDSASQHDDDNISTTSGFSSRASDKDVSVSKNTSAPPLWSPEPDRSHSFSHHSSTSLKKPAFNLSAFGSLSPSLANTSVVKSSQLGDSPFYPGKTAYGGAASTRPSKVRTTPYQFIFQAPMRRQMKAKQSSVQSYGVTSSTARRILQSLDKMSSPLADARRIPSATSSPLALTPERSFLDATEFHSRKKIESHYPPVQKLMTPKSISVHSNRSLYIKPSLPAFQSSKISRRTEDGRVSRKRGLLSEAMQENADQSFSYPKSSTPSANGLSSGGGKMRRERGAHYTKCVQDGEDADVPELPNIALPICTASLPSFSFGSISKTTSSPSIVVTKPAHSMVPPTSSLNSSPVFTFSSPIVKSKETEAPALGSPIGFTFSIPSVKSADPSVALKKPASMIVSPAKDVVLNSTSSKKDEEQYEGPFKPAKTLKEGSVLDILKSPGFASPKTSAVSSSLPLTNTLTLTRPGISTFSTGGMTFGETSKQDTLWQCDTCLVQNKTTENKCKACSAAKAPTLDAAKQTVTSTPSSTTKTTIAPSGFGDKFKPAAGVWDCDTCLVQNKPEMTKCVACETPKPGTGVKPALTLSAHTKAVVAVTASPSSFPPHTNLLGFGDKFKRPPGSWDCTVCLVQNKAEDSKCVSCLSQKPGDPAPVTSSSAISVSASSTGPIGFGDKFKKPDGAWDCETCLVQNKPDTTKCAACQSAKPGTKAELTGFETSAPSSAAAPSFKFGIESSEASKTSGSISGFKFGDQGGFKFGATTSDSGSSNTATAGFSFPKGGEFSFGIQSTNSKTEPKKDSPQGSTGFTFGLASGTTNTPAAPLQFGTQAPAQQEKDLKTTSSGFAFGSVSTNSTAQLESTGAFSFKKAEEKSEATASPFSFGKPSDKIETPAPLGGFTFGKVDPPKATVSVPTFVVGRTEDKSDAVGASGPSLMFGTQTDKEPVKPAFSFGKSDQTKADPARPTFSFSVAKPAESKEAEPSAKQSLTFGVSTSTPDQGAANPSFSFLPGTSSSTAVSSTLATSNSAFGSSVSASNPPAASFVFGQASSTSGSSAFGSANEVKTPQSFMFSTQESKPATTSSSTGTTAAATPFVFGPVASSNNTSTPNFGFGAANTSSSTGTTNSPFVFGSGSSAAVAPSFGNSKTPAFGQGSTQTNTPAFTPVFSAGSQPSIAFGSGPANSQPPVFGQQASQPPAFGTATATSNAGPSFQFGGNTSFNFSSSTPSGIFTFGSNTAAPTAQPPQPSSTGNFGFNQPAPSFTLGANVKNTSNRRIKTAVRRRK